MSAKTAKRDTHTGGRRNRVMTWLGIVLSLTLLVGCLGNGPNGAPNDPVAQNSAGVTPPAEIVPDTGGSVFQQQAQQDEAVLAATPTREATATAFAPAEPEPQAASNSAPELTPTPENQGGHFPVTNGEVRLAWFYKPPQDRDLTPLFDHFDVFILTKNDENTRQELEDSGVDSPILQYLRFDAIMDPGSCDTRPWQNQVANKAGDFCWISNEQPDWFLLDSKGRRIDAGDGFVHMDPGNEEWRYFWLKRARQSQEELGWNGVFLHNVQASLDRYNRQKKIELENYPDQASFQTAVDGFLKYIYDEYFQPENRPLAANIIFLEESSTWFSYLRNLDIVMDESWALDWSDHYLSPEEWEEDAYRAVTTQAMGKDLILVSLGDQWDEDRQEFAFASYLLVNNGRASFRYASAKEYDQAWIYPNYQYDLGEPAGPMAWNGEEWCREFAKGRVCVDPAERDASIEVDD